MYEFEFVRHAKYRTLVLVNHNIHTIYVVSGSVEKEFSNHVQKSHELLVFKKLGLLSVTQQ